MCDTCKHPGIEGASNAGGYAEQAQEYRGALEGLKAPYHGGTHNDLKFQQRRLIQQHDVLIGKIKLLGQLISLFEN